MAYVPKEEITSYCFVKSPLLEQTKQSTKLWYEIRSNAREGLFGQEIM
jgi:hypothetical protein